LMRHVVPLILALALATLSNSYAQPEWSISDAPGPAWPEVAFPLPPSELESATPGTLVALGLVIDLREPSRGVVADSTLVLNPTLLQALPLTFYLNPGLEIQRLHTAAGVAIAFERDEFAVRLRPPPVEGQEPFIILSLGYAGVLDATSSLFDPLELSQATLGEHFSFLPPESLWYPWMPGQNATGRLRVLTPAGTAAWGPAAEETIIEREGRRTTDFVWHRPAHRLALAWSDWKSAQVQRNQLVLELVLPPERLQERSRLYTLTLQKVDFYGRAFYPLPWERLNLLGQPDAGAFGDGHGLIVLPEDQLTVHLLGHPLLDRLLARQWFGELLQFDPRQAVIEQGWVEFATRLYLEAVSAQEAQAFWESEGRWLTRLAQPEVAWHFKVPWILRLIESRLGRAAFWELNQEFFQRHLYRQVTMADYLELAEEILAGEPPGDQLRQIVQPWFQDTSIPVLAYSAQVIDSSPPQLVVQVNQQTEQPWQLALDLDIRQEGPSGSRSLRRETLVIQEAIEQFMFTVPQGAITVQLDPEWRVLCKRTRMDEQPGKGLPPGNRDLEWD